MIIHSTFQNSFKIRIIRSDFTKNSIVASYIHIYIYIYIILLSLMFLSLYILNILEMKNEAKCNMLIKCN